MFTRQQTVTHPSTNRDRRTATLMIEANEPNRRGGTYSIQSIQSLLSQAKALIKGILVFF